MVMKHPLTLLQNPAKFACYGCGTEGDVILYFSSNNKNPSDGSAHDALDLRPIPNESIFLATNDVKNCAGEESIVLELGHAIHRHCLTLCDEVKPSEQCNGCTMPIFGPYYSCSECNFFLHRSFTQLRSEIRHPFHLEQRPKPERPMSDWFFCCNLCWSLCSGFSYRCKYCDFTLNIMCSSILSVLNHEAHEHVLTLDSLHVNWPLSQLLDIGYNNARDVVQLLTISLRLQDI
ncbi:hypothetical protein Acr_29g0001050 [Actinidia rufa]|uniref:DC1 domain-containing protein n=1 Tax=Actinidia rufa TaxID=165716 RepID=A0A7J0HCV2_9ERIC|nr:hypothetical protein Acr_29g0001050 [Actinidia rufa]